MVGSGGFCVWWEPGFSRRKDVFKINLLYNCVCKLCAFNVIFIDNSAINCITDQRKRSILLNVEGSYYAKYCRNLGRKYRNCS